MYECRQTITTGRAEQQRNSGETKRLHFRTVASKVFSKQASIFFTNKMDKITPRQKEIVIEQWKTVRANPKKNGPLLFVKVFEMFPEYRSYFVPTGFGNVPLEDLPNDKILLGHGTFVIYALNSLLDNLEEPDVMLSLLKKIGKSHGAKGITSDPFKNVPCIVVEFMKGILGGLDKESEEAWTACMEAACTAIASHLGD